MPWARPTDSCRFDRSIDVGGEQYEAPLNTLKHRDPTFTPTDTKVVTPNLDTPYFLLWMDLRTEPLVLGVPKIEDERYYSIQLIDFYHFTFDYIGSRATGNAAGRYLIAGPKWTGETPANISKVMRSETDRKLLGRSGPDLAIRPHTGFEFLQPE